MDPARLGGGATTLSPPITAIADPTCYLQLSGDRTSAVCPDDINCNEESYIPHDNSPGAHAEYIFYHNADDAYPHFDSFFGVDDNPTHVNSCTSCVAQHIPHNGYVSLGDIELNNTLSAPVTATQPPQSPFDRQHGGDVQDGNGLTNFWFLHGVSAGQDAVVDDMHAKLQEFGGWRLDADFIHEDPIQRPEDDLQTSTSQRSPYRNPSASTECQNLREIVRLWLSNHASRPYPSQSEKKTLAESAGCSVNQLEICFRNIRARERHLFDSHIDVRSGGITTNAELHANMSAQSSYAQPGFVSFADATSPCNVTSPSVTNTSDSSSWPSPSDPCYLTLDHNQDTETQVYQHPAAESARQEALIVSALHKAAVPKRKGRRYHAQRHHYSRNEHLPFATQQTSSSPSFQGPENRFHCTVCVKAFKNASDWKRHEASVHGYNDREWVCMLTDAFKLQSECVFCLEPMDSIDHLDKHATDPCSNKCTAERSFPRKDLLKQHVLLAHLADAPPSIKKTFEVPTEWSRGLNVSPGGPASRWCGFCGYMLETTAKRMDHVAQHFRNGQNMMSWTRM